jgi:hypothetical protein
MPLAGMKLSIWRRAANMLNIQFGEIKKLDRGSVGEWAMHAQCPWRLMNGDLIVTGNNDLYEPAKPGKRFNWNKWYDEATWTDNKMESIVHRTLGGYDRRTRSIVNIGRKFIVSSIKITKCGDCTILFTHGWKLQFFANGVTGERYRFINHSTKNHFVFGE